MLLGLLDLLGWDIGSVVILQLLYLCLVYFLLHVDEVGLGGMGSGGVAALRVGLLVGVLARVSGLAGVGLIGVGWRGAVGNLGTVAHLLVVVAELLLVGFVASLVSHLLHA